MKKTGNPDCILHCLPALHDLETATGKEVHDKYGLSEMEVSDEVFPARRARCSMRRKIACTPSKQ